MYGIRFVAAVVDDCEVVWMSISLYTNWRDFCTPSRATEGIKLLGSLFLDC